MHINVRDILAESAGYSRSYKITGERPSLAELRLTEDIEGEITIFRLDSGLLVKGRVTTELELECDRCLRSFNRPTTITFQQLFAEVPSDDELPIAGDLIDLAPLLEQELLLSLPIKILHSPDCQGIEMVSEQYTKTDTASSLKHQARITKGTQRGRTQET